MVASLDTDYALSQNQIDGFRRDGHALLRGVALPEVIDTYRPAIVETAMAYNREQRQLAERDTYGQAFLQITNLWQRDEKVKQFVLARRFGKIAADLLGVDGVRIYHDQALFKEPGGGFTPWHQDQYYWPLDTDNTITMWMPMVDLTADMGIMRFASGSHKENYLGELPISDESEEKFKAYVAERGYTLQSAEYMKAGDATFHTGWTLHNAPGNNTDSMREVMTIIYYADGTRVSTPDNKNRQSDLETWLPGLQAGDVAASDLNPLAYSRA